MDLSQLSDEELQAAYDQMNQERQAAAELKRKNYVPSQEEIDEADRQTGLKDASTLYKFNAGLLGAGEQALKQPGRIITELTGTEEEKAAYRKEVDDERKLMSHAGTAGAIGGFVGDVATSLLPGGLALKGAKALGAGRLLSGTAGYAAAGAGGSLLSAKGTGDSYLLDAGLGAVGGAALGNLVKGGTKAIQKLVGAGSKGKAKQQVSDYLVSQMQNMDDSQKTVFAAAIGKYLKSPASSLDTPGQVIGQQAGLGTQALQAQADLIRNKNARYAFTDLNVKQQQADLDVIDGMAKTLGSVKLVNDLPPRDAVSYYISQVQKRRSDATREGFEALKQTPSNPQLKQDFLIKQGDNGALADAKQYLDKALKDPNIFASERAPLERLYKALQAKPGTAYDRPTVGDYAELYQYMGQHFPDLNSSKARAKLQAARASLGDLIGTYSPEFKEVNKVYAQMSGPLNSIQESPLIKKAMNDASSVFKSTGNAADSRATDLGKWMSQNTPEALNQMTANEVFGLVGALRRKGSQKGITLTEPEQRVLNRLEMVNGNNPMTKQIVSAIKEHLIKPKNVVSNEAVAPKGLGIAGLYPVDIVSKLHDEKYQRALLSVLSDTKTWAPIADRLLKTKGKDGLITLLDLASTGLAGALGTEAALLSAPLILGQ